MQRQPKIDDSMKLCFKVNVLFKWNHSHTNMLMREKKAFWEFEKFCTGNKPATLIRLCRKREMCVQMFFSPPHRKKNYCLWWNSFIFPLTIYQFQCAHSFVCLFVYSFECVCEWIVFLAFSFSLRWKSEKYKVFIQSISVYRSLSLFRFVHFHPILRPVFECFANISKIKPIPKLKLMMPVIAW